MKKLLVVGVVSLALAALAPAVGAAPPLKACADINGISTSYLQNPDGTYTFSAQMFLGPEGTSAACQNLTYTTYILTDPSATPIPVAGTPSPDGQGVLFGPITLTDNNTQIQIYSTSERNGRIFDRAPDSGYLLIDSTVTGGKVPYG
jgi:hypothetical protein